MWKRQGRGTEEVRGREREREGDYKAGAIAPGPWLKVGCVLPGTGPFAPCLEPSCMQAIPSG